MLLKWFSVRRPFRPGMGWGNSGCRNVYQGSLWHHAPADNRRFQDEIVSWAHQCALSPTSAQDWRLRRFQS